MSIDISDIMSTPDDEGLEGYLSLLPTLISDCVRAADKMQAQGQAISKRIHSQLNRINDELRTFRVVRFYEECL